MEERQQINVESMVGSKVYIQLHRQSFDMLGLQGVESERFVAKVAGMDGFGIWIENPNYCTIPTYDDNGDYIPPEDRKQICDRAVILIMWPNIQTIMQFPDRVNYRASDIETEIGFRVRTQPATVVAQPLTPIGVPSANGSDGPSANSVEPAKGKGKDKKGSKRG
jgi:hypothetical protein